MAKHLNHEELDKLQNALDGLTINQENFASKSLSDVKNLALQNGPLAWDSISKEKALFEYNFWKNKLMEYKGSFEGISSKFS